MPIYEYTCVTCSNRFDKRRSMSQMNDPASCPDCGSESRRVFSVFAAFSSGQQRSDQRRRGSRRLLRWWRRWCLRLCNECLIYRLPLRTISHVNQEE